MRVISADTIRNTAADLCIQANLFLRPDILQALRAAYKEETNKRAKKILMAIVENARIAKKEKLAICQDTGMPEVFLEAGRDVKIAGDLKAAVNKGVEEGYIRGSLRNSIVKDPLLRGASKYSPAVIHTEIVKGNKLKITVLPKGFGCENKTQLKMFKPTAEISEVKKFIVQAVKAAGADACPPYVVGVGIGGTADYACLLAKKALLRKVKSQKSKVKSANQNSKIEKELLFEINKLNIGPMGLGGKATALAVKIETYPTHIAGLPVCVNISCHALRSASKEIFPRGDLK
jgi:fumarate hydratase subunit alpha